MTPIIDIRIPETILVEGDRAKLTTTIFQLRLRKACVPRFAALLNALGLASIDATRDLSSIDRQLVVALQELTDEQRKSPINLLSILELNGTEDCLWALCATEQDCKRQAWLIAADIAESVLHNFESRHPNDSRPRETIATMRRYARGEADIAACSAARSAAWSAAWSAADSAACSAARSAAWSAAWSVNAQIICRYLISEEATS